VTYLLLTHLYLLRQIPVRQNLMRLNWKRLVPVRMLFQRIYTLDLIPSRLYAMRPNLVRWTHRPRVVLAGLFLGLSAHPTIAHACAVCVGDPNDPQTKGASSAVLLLMGITGCVLSGFVAFFGYLWWRGRNPLDAATTYAGRPQDKLREEEVRS